jgi:hypothetical protein
LKKEVVEEIREQKKNEKEIKELSMLLITLPWLKK